MRKCHSKCPKHKKVGQQSNENIYCDKCSMIWE